MECDGKLEARRDPGGIPLPVEIESESDASSCGSDEENRSSGGVAICAETIKIPTTISDTRWTWAEDLLCIWGLSTCAEQNIAEHSVLLAVEGSTDEYLFQGRAIARNLEENCSFLES